MSLLLKKYKEDFKRLLVAGCWLLVAGCWLLVAGCWLLVAGCWLYKSQIYKGLVAVKKAGKRF